MGIDAPGLAQQRGFVRFRLRLQLGDIRGGGADGVLDLRFQRGHLLAQLGQTAIAAVFQRGDALAVGPHHRVGGRLHLTLMTAQGGHFGIGIGQHLLHRPGLVGDVHRVDGGKAGGGIQRAQTVDQLQQTFDRKLRVGHALTGVDVSERQAFLDPHHVCASPGIGIGGRFGVARHRRRTRIGLGRTADDGVEFAVLNRYGSARRLIVGLDQPDRFQ